MNELKPFSHWLNNMSEPAKDCYLVAVGKTSGIKSALINSTLRKPDLRHHANSVMMLHLGLDSFRAACCSKGKGVKFTSFSSIKPSKNVVWHLLDWLPRCESQTKQKYLPYVSRALNSIVLWIKSHFISVISVMTAADTQWWSDGLCSSPAGDKTDRIWPMEKVLTDTMTWHNRITWRIVVILLWKTN